MEPLIFLGLMAVAFWFLIIRPQRQRQATHRAMVSEIGPGDEVITSGGVYGTVKSVADDHLVLEIAPNTQIRLAREAVATRVPKPEENPAPDANDG